MSPKLKLEFSETGKLLFSVLSCGAGGGLLMAIYERFQGEEARFGTFQDATFYAAMGAVAAVSFIFVIAKTDRTDKVHLVVLALVCGLFWPPVIETAGQLVQTKREERHAVRLTEQLDQIAVSTRRLSETQDREEREQLATSIRKDLVAAAADVEDVDELSTRTSIALQAFGVAEQLRQAAPETKLNETASLVGVTASPQVLSTTPDELPLTFHPGQGWRREPRELQTVEPEFGQG